MELYAHFIVERLVRMTMLVLYLNVYSYMYRCEQLAVNLSKTCHFQAKYIVAMSTDMGYNIRWRHTKFFTFKTLPGCGT